MPARFDGFVAASKKPERWKTVTARSRKPRLAAVEAAPARDGLEGLSAESRAWVELVERDYAVDEHHRKVLLVAAQAWDLSQEMRRVLDDEGYTYFVARLGAYRPRPEAQIMHDAELRMLRALRDLGLDDAPTAMGPLAYRHGNSKQRRR